MKWSFDAHLLANTVVVKVSDALEPRDVRQMLLELLDSPFWNPTINIAYNCSDLDVSLSTVADIRDLSEIYKEIGERCIENRTAILTNTLIKFGLGRQLQILTGLIEGPKIKVFNDWDQMAEWVTMDFSLRAFETSDPNLISGYRRHLQ